MTQSGEFGVLERPMWRLSSISEKKTGSIVQKTLSQACVSVDGIKKQLGCREGFV